jgi:Protein of unknown function (DUF3443)
MITQLHAVRTAFCAILGLALISCGGGGGGKAGVSPTQPTPAANVAAVIVDGGPEQQSVNTLFTSVTLCVPGSTTQCTTIDHIQVDTASFGFRVLASALPAGFTLPVQSAASGGSLVECVVFGDGYSWGPVALADFTIGGETAPAMPVQVIGDSRFLPASTACSSQTTGGEEDTVSDFGANGIIGIGVEPTDCPGCSQSTGPDVYFACTSASACTSTLVPLANQVPNPIARFPVDNNGSFIVLPSVPVAGATTVSGSLIFGVDTQTNNQSGSQTVVFVDASNAELTMIYKGTTLPDSFIDSGTNGIFFNDSTLTTCAGNASGFYCPSTTQNLPLLIKLSSGGNFSTSFNVANPSNVSNTITAFPGLAGSIPASFDDNNSFDYGLAFFYGRKVSTVIAGKTTSVGTGPYIAF